MAKYKLDELCEFITDGTHQTPKYCDDGGVIFLSSKDVTERKINWDDVKYIPESLHHKLYKRLSPRRNDILLAKNGTTGVAAVVDRDEVFDVYVSLAVLRPVENIYPKYLLYAINSPVAKRQFNAGLKGIGVPNLHLGVIRETIVNVVSKGEQEKICEILDKIVSVIDNRKTELSALDDLMKARFVEMFGVINNDVPLSYYIASLNAGKSLAGEEECSNKVLKTGAVTYDFFDATQVKNLPLDYEPQEDHRVSVGDVIVSRMNTAELVGAAAYVWDVPERFYLPDRLWRAEIKDTANPIFVWQVLIQSSTKERIRRIASGTSGSMKNISKSGLLGIRVVKAPIELQNQFADFVRQVAKSKVAVQKALDETQLLFDSLMQQYFG